MSRGWSRNLDGLTVLAVRYPDCVIGIRGPGLWPSFKGRFRNCIFFHDEELALPTKFICGAWCQCQVWTDEGYASLRRSVKVTMSKPGHFIVTLAACKDAGSEDQRWPEESTGYIFQLDAGGDVAHQVIRALERHYMFFTQLWIERFDPTVPPFLNHQEMVKELLKQLTGNDGFLKFLGSIVTDQDFRQQHGKLLQLMYDDYEAAVLSKPVVEVRMGTGSLTMVPRSLPVMRDTDSLLSSCARTEDGAKAHSLSLSIADPEKVPCGSLNGLEFFEPSDYSATITAEEDCKFLIGDVPKSGPGSSQLEPEVVVTDTATEDRENLRGDNSVCASKSDDKVAFSKDFNPLLAKWGLERIIQEIWSLTGCAPERCGSPPLPTCDPVQRQDSGPMFEAYVNGSTYIPLQVTSGTVDHESPETAESDTS